MAASAFHLNCSINNLLKPIKKLKIISLKVGQTISSCWQAFRMPLIDQFDLAG